MKSVMQVGTTMTLKRVMTQQDFNRFAALSGDNNPIHVDPEFSARTRFGKTVAHGMFLYSLICCAIDRFFPGATQLSQDLMFPNPTYVGEPVTVSLTIAEIEPAERLARLQTAITQDSGLVSCHGETSIRWSET
jgi:3-hydroxybutyryl-CoA dehydratase